MIDKLYTQLATEFKLPIDKDSKGTIIKTNEERTLFTT